MTPQAPCCFKYCSTACSRAISDTERERESRRSGEREGVDEGSEEIKGWQGKWKSDRKGWRGGGDGQRWLVYLVGFFLLRPLSRASVLPAEAQREMKVWGCSAAGERKGEVSSCRDGEEQSRRGVQVGENSLSWTTSWILNATFAFHWLRWSVIRRLPEKHLQSDLKYIGTPSWILYWNSLI